MPDHRKHRGPHPEDKQLFAAEQCPRLREAANDLAWLLNRGYASTSALKIVGDRGWIWETSLVPDPDRDLIATDHIVASSDSQILDGTSQWFNLARHAIQLRVPDAWVVDLSK